MMCGILRSLNSERGRLAEEVCRRARRRRRRTLKRLISGGSAPARELNRARILLFEAARGEHSEEALQLSYSAIARMLETSSATVGRVREQFFMQGLDAALERSMPDRLYERTEPKQCSRSLLVRSKVPSERR
jgi:hypothetical protein